MLAEYKTKTNIGVGLGFVCQVAGRLMLQSEQPTAPAATAAGILIIGGLVLFIWGCRNYAIGKGQNPAWGFMGLLSCLGLIVLVLLPDRYKDQGSAPPGAFPPRPPIPPGRIPPPPPPPPPIKP